MRTLVTLGLVGACWIGWLTVTKETTGQLPKPVHEVCRSLVEWFESFTVRKAG